MVAANVYGGGAHVYFSNEKSESIVVSNNSVIVDSASVLDGRIVGGLIEDGKVGFATNNTVSLTGNYSVDRVSLYGGFRENKNITGDFFTGNTLNLDARQVSTTSVNEVANFETINIRVGAINNGGIVLNTKNTILGAEDTSKGTVVNLLSVDSSLEKGDTLILISNAKGNLVNDGQIQSVDRGSGFAVKYDALISGNDNKITAQIVDSRLNPETAILNESRLASLAFVNGGADLLQDLDIDKDKNIFGIVRGNHSRYDTGSSVAVDGVHLVSGFSYTRKGLCEDTTGGAFIEGGFGRATAHNSIENKTLHGKGNTHYLGVGVLARYDRTQGVLRGLYADTTLRVGKISSNYHSKDVINAEGQQVRYDTRSAYYGVHFGTGYRRNLTKKLEIDAHARYMWTRINGVNESIFGDQFHFDKMNSHRSRIGFRAEHNTRQCASYVGVDWEYEFDGKAKGSVFGYSMKSSDFSGSSGVLTLGMKIKPSENSPMTLDAGVVGYVGKHRGVAGQLKMVYKF